MIDSHFRALRNTPRYARAHIRVFIEANMSFIDAGRVANQVACGVHGDVHVVRFDPHGRHRYGIWTTKDKKIAYCQEIQREIDHLCLADDFISAHPKEVLEALLQQLGSFRDEVTMPESGVALFAQRNLTGKSLGKTDDLWMALGIALFHMMRSAHDLDFAQLCQLRGWAPA